MSFWLIAVPSQGQSDALSRLNGQTVGMSKNHQFKIPPLKVGTLDQLMALSDDLAKYDTIVGQVAKKIEKTYIEMYRAEPKEEKKATTPAPAAATAGASSSSSGQPVDQPPELRVSNFTAKEYVEGFTWNDLRYPKRSPLRQLTDMILKETNKNDEILKKQTQEYNETKTTYATMERKDTGTLLVRPLGPYVKQSNMVETAHLTTLMVIVPRARKDEWETTYEILEELHAQKEKEEKEKKEQEQREREEKERQQAAEEAKNNANSASAIKSKAEQQRELEKQREKAKEEEAARLEAEMDPDAAKRRQEEREAKEAEEKKKNRKLPCKIVVPRSSLKLCDEGTEEFILYRVVVLREGAEAYKNLCRDKRFTVRPFKYDPEEDRIEKEKKAELAKKRKAQWAYLIRWCPTTYAEVFSAWIHIKAIRLYVEAVLRYGLPVDFKAMLLEPSKGKDKQLRGVLRQLYGNLAGGNAALTTQLDPNETDLSGLGADFYPYVYLPLSIQD